MIRINKLVAVLLWLGVSLDLYEKAMSEHSPIWRAFCWLTTAVAVAALYSTVRQPRLCDRCK